MTDTERPAAAEHGDIVDRLEAACIGHPYAKILWPHRLLHDAKKEITQQRSALRECHKEIFNLRNQLLRYAPSNESANG